MISILLSRKINYIKSHQIVNQSGFTLIELAVVLVIMGLIIGTITPLIVSVIKRDKLAEGRDVVKIAKDEIMGYAFTNNVLPTASNWTNVVGHTTDPWHQTLFYVPAPNLFDATGTPLDVCSFSGSTGLSVNLCNDASCSSFQQKTDIAFVIGSSGENFNRQTSNGTSGVINIYNYGIQADDYLISPDPNRTSDGYDDIVIYVTLSEIVGRVCN